MNDKRKYSEICRGIQRREEGNDIFYTSQKLARNLIEMVPLEKGDTVLDPALGTGSFYDNFPEYVEKDYCEIEEGKDFFKYDKKADWIITNPPYSILDDWFRKSCKISHKGFGYLIGIKNLTAKRIEECNEHDFGLTKLHIFKIYEWFGMSCFILFEKGKENIITYDRTVWHAKKPNETYKQIDYFFK